MQFLKVDDAVLHYQVIGGPENGPVLVFANALVTIARHAEDLAAIMDHAGLGSAVICGLSVGGLIAQQLYIDRRDLVSALILCDTAAKLGDAQSWSQRIATVEANGIAALSDSVMPNWFTGQFRADRSEELAGYRTMLERQSPAGYMATCAAIRDADLREKARQIGVPAICIVGDEDGSTPVETVADLAKSIPGSRFEIIKGAAHLPCVETPERLADIILVFIGGLENRVTLN